MKYVEPNMEIIEFDEDDITTSLGVSGAYTEGGGGSSTTIPEDKWN